MAKINLNRMSNDAFTRAMQGLLQQKLPVKTAFKVKTLTNRFNDELKKFAELRAIILDRYCTKGEDGKPLLDAEKNYQFTPEVLQSVTKEMGDLLAIEFEFEAIKVDELGDISLTPNDLIILGDILDA